MGLAPLADTAFNLCKSEIKALDYAALGLLPLLSDGPAYRADPVLARHAYFSGPDDWLMMMREILNNREAAAARAAMVEAHVWNQRVVARGAAELVDRLEAYRR